MGPTVAAVGPTVDCRIVTDEYPMYALSEEHQAIREAVRAVCDAKVAPYAAEVDEEARYPQEAADALLAADFHAPHVPEEYGGAGADALATVHRDRGGRPGLRLVVADPGGQQARLAAGACSAAPRSSRRRTSPRWPPARAASPTACPSPTPARTRRR